MSLISSSFGFLSSRGLAGRFQPEAGAVSLGLMCFECSDTRPGSFISAKYHLDYSIAESVVSISSAGVLDAASIAAIMDNSNYLTFRMYRDQFLF
jgi:hypothetical protein